MNQLIKVSVGVLALSMGSMAFAGESNWAESKKAPNVYSPGIDKSTFHAAPSLTPSNGWDTRMRLMAMVAKVGSKSPET